MKIKGKDITDGATSVWRAYDLDKEGAETKFKHKKNPFLLLQKNERVRTVLDTDIYTHTHLK